MSDVNHRGNSVWGIWELCTPFAICKPKIILKYKLKQTNKQTTTQILFLKIEICPPQTVKLKKQILKDIVANSSDNNTQNLPSNFFRDMNDEEFLKINSPEVFNSATALQHNTNHCQVG